MVDDVETGARGGEPRPPGGERTTRVLTVPNVICVLRLLGSFVLVAMAWVGRSDVFLWLFVALALSDWVDGKLAILLNQRSVLGARLDSWADAALYFALLVGMLLLHGDILRGEAAWIGLAVATYTISTLMGFWKYRRWPSYHTRAAKVSWFLVLAGAVSLLAGWSPWPLRIGMAAVTFTNLEAMLITSLCPTWRADVGSVLQVLRRRDG